MITNNDRSKLGFLEKARVAFDPLMVAHGFQCVSEQLTFVRYESDLLFVNVYHGRASFELGVGVGLRDSASEMEQGYSLSELVRMFDSDRAEGLRYWTARTPESLEKGVRLLIDLFAQYAGKILEGNPTYFARLKEQRARWKKDYASEVNAAQVRPKAEEAFRLRDFSEAVRLYESMSELLTPTERKKLDFAHCKMGSRK